jgi:hypothetical protein
MVSMFLNFSEDKYNCLHITYYQYITLKVYLFSNLILHSSARIVPYYLRVLSNLWRKGKWIQKKETEFEYVFVVNLHRILFQTVITKLVGIVFVIKTCIFHINRDPCLSRQ